MTDRFKRFMGSPTANFIIVVMVVVSMTIGVQAIVARRDLAQCVADWGEKDATATAERARAATQDRDLDKADRTASLTLYRTLRDSRDPVVNKAAFDAWIKILEENEVKREENERIRTMNPTPPPPSLSCE